MRVLFLGAWFPFPADNGSKIRVYHLLRAVGEKHEVTLVSLAFGSSRPEQFSTLCQAVYPIFYNPFVRPRLFQWLRYFSLSPIMALPIRAMNQVVNELLNTSAFDVVIASTEVVARYALRFQIPRILEEHNSLSRLMQERYEAEGSYIQRTSHWVAWQKAQFYEQRLFQQFDQVVMVSERDRQMSQQLVAKYPGRVQCVPNGVDCEHNRPGLAVPIPNTLIFNGSLTYQANYDAIDYFLQTIYPLIQTAIPNVSLTITGSTDGVPLEKLKTDNTVHFTNYLADVRPAVAQSWICVVPLRQGGGTRLKILEAMALGTPVVATSKGAEGLDLKPNKHILIADKPETFACTVIQLLQNTPLCQTLATNGRQLVETHYNWQAIGQQFLQLVEETATKPTHSPIR